MDLDSLKNTWRDFSVPDSRLENETAEIARKLSRGKAESSQKRLADSYVVVALMGLCVAAMSPMVFTILELPLWVAVLYGIFGLTMAVIDFWFSRKVRRENYLSLPVVTALSRVVEIRKLQRQLRMVSLSFGAVVVGSLMWEAYVENGNLPMLLGMLLGIAIGVPIGIVKWRQLVRLAKEMQDEIRDALS